MGLTRLVPTPSPTPESWPPGDSVGAAPLAVASTGVDPLPPEDAWMAMPKEREADSFEVFDLARILVLTAVSRSPVGAVPNNVAVLELN